MKIKTLIRKSTVFKEIQKAGSKKDLFTIKFSNKD